MPTYSQSPRLLKADIVAIDSDNPLLSSVTVFQYNPHTLTGRLEPQMMEGDSRAETSGSRALLWRRSTSR